MHSQGIIWGAVKITTDRKRAGRWAGSSTNDSQLMSWAENCGQYIPKELWVIQYLSYQFSGLSLRFWFVFPWWLMILGIFMSLLVICISSLGLCLFRSFCCYHWVCPFVVIAFLFLLCKKSLYNLDQILFTYIICKYFILSFGFSFSFLDRAL